MKRWQFSLRSPLALFTTFAMIFSIMSWSACIESNAIGLNSVSDYGTMALSEIDSDSIDASSNQSMSNLYRGGFKYVDEDFNIISGLDSDAYYKVNLSLFGNFSFGSEVLLRNAGILLDEYCIYFDAFGFLDSSAHTNHTVNSTFDVILPGSVLDSSSLEMRVEIFRYVAGSITYDLDIDFVVNSYEVLSSSESGEFEDGYNAGYSDGYSDGLLDGGSADDDGSYDDGYSDGFADGEASVDTDGIYDDGYSDGFADGEASVDTDSIYSDAYQAGYEAGLLDGSDDTLKEGKTLVVSINDSFTIPGQIMNNYYSQYITEPAVSFVTGSASHTIELPMSSYFDVGKDYLVDLRLVSAENKNETYSVTIGEYLGHSIYPFPRFTLSGPGLNMNSMGESIYSPTQTGTFKLSVSVPADFSILSTYYEGIESEYVSMPSYGNAIGQLNWDSEISYIIDIYEVEIIEEIDYLRDQSNKLNDLNNTQQESLDVSKETAETTKNMFSSMKEFFGSFFDNFINSFIRLFVPESSYFTDYFDRLNTFFEEKFGFLYQPIGFFVDIVNAFLGDWGDYSLVFPGFSWEGQEVWPDIEFSFDDTVSAFPKVFEYIRLATNISILVALINLIYRKYEEVMRN